MTTPLEVLERRLLETVVLCETEAARLEERGDQHGAAWWTGRAFDLQRMLTEARREHDAVREIRHG